MPASSDASARLPEIVFDARRRLQRGAVGVANLLADLPGERPPWVVLTLRGSYPPRPQPRRLELSPPRWGARPQSLAELEHDIERLCAAPWLQGVVLRFAELQLSAAGAYALRALVARLRASGKRVTAYLEAPHLLEYYLACAADRVVLPPGAEPHLQGLALEVRYWRRALARAGVAVDKVAVGPHKDAGDPFVREHMSDATREQYGRLLESWAQELQDAIGSDRGVAAATVGEWLDAGVVDARDMLERGMIDAVAYEDEVVPREAAPLATARRRLRRPLPARAGARVAVVSLRGTIVMGESRRLPASLPLVGGELAGAATVTRSLRRAAQDPRVAAVVLVVASGGGSALASDLIWREVARCAARKPLVAVMAQAAASGGYYVLTHATRVLAAPTTLTGSIGVVSAKLVLAEAYRRLGVNVDTIRRHRFATLHSDAHPYDEAERALVERSIDATYRRFVARVAEGRRLSPERVEALARGRVWSGRDALERGLVDRLGTPTDAVRLACELAELPPDAAVRDLRAPRGPLLPHRDHDADAFASLTASWSALASLARERALLLQPREVRLRG